MLKKSVQYACLLCVVEMQSGGEGEHYTQSLDSRFKCTSKFKFLLQILLKLYLWSYPYIFVRHTVLQDFGIYIFGLKCQLLEGPCLFNSTVFPCLNFAYSFAEDSIMVEFMSGEKTF